MGLNSHISSWSLPVQVVICRSLVSYWSFGNTVVVVSTLFKFFSCILLFLQLYLSKQYIVNIQINNHYGKLSFVASTGGMWTSVARLCTYRCRHGSEINQKISQFCSVCCFMSPSRIFRSWMSSGERLQNLGLCSAPKAFKLKRKIYSACVHVYIALFFSTRKRNIN